MQSHSHLVSGRYLNAVSVSSAQVSRSVVSNSLRPHESQHARPPCPSSTPGVYSNSCPSSQWCHPAISSSAVPFSSCPQSLPASGSFPVSQPFTCGGQSTGVSASASVLPMNTQDWSPSGWTRWISLQSKRLSRVFSNTTVQKHRFFSAQLSSHPYMTTGKTIALTRRTFVSKVMSLLFNMLSRLVITFLPRSKHILISWLPSPSAVILEPQKLKSDTVSSVSPSISHEVMGPDAMIPPSAVILEPPKIKSDTVSTLSPSISYEVMGPDAMILVFWMLSFKPTFSLSTFTFIKRFFSSSSLSAVYWFPTSVWLISLYSFEH